MKAVSYSTSGPAEGKSFSLLYIHPYSSIHPVSFVSKYQNERLSSISKSQSNPSLHVTVLEYSESYPKPQRKGKQDVLIKIAATAMNPVDWKIRKIRIPGQPSNFIPGADFAGTVVDCDQAESGFKPGDKVFGMLPILEAPGACAEFVLAKAKHISLAPTNVSMPEAAALPLVALTVMQAFDKIGIKEDTADEVKGRSILIHAGAGGVGMFASDCLTVDKAELPYIIYLG